MLEIVAPEIYSSRPRRSVKLETKARIKLPKSETKPKREWKRPNMDVSLDEVEVVGATAPRRPYQWKGRRVRRVLRPGTVVMFTPGARSAERAAKRSADELYGDEDLLEQLEAREGEFRYGKRGRTEAEAVVLDNSNPTPSLQPVTPQIPVASAAVKRGAVPTVQVLAPKKRRFTEAADQVLPAAPLTEMDTAPPGTAVLFPARAVKQARRRRPTAPPALVVEDVKPESMVVEDVKFRDVKPVGPGIGVQTIDIKVPSVDVKPVVPKVEVMETTTTPAVAYGPASRIFPTVRLHPSQMGFAKYVRPKRRRRVTRRRRAAVVAVAAPPQRRRAPRRRTLLPAVRYHPSLVTAPRAEMAIWR